MNTDELILGKPRQGVLATRLTIAGDGKLFRERESMAGCGRSGKRCLLRIEECGMVGTSRFAWLVVLGLVLGRGGMEFEVLLKGGICLGSQALLVMWIGMLRVAQVCKKGQSVRA